MGELYRPKTRAEFRAETWEPVETWQREPGRPVYTIVKSCHGWYSWRRYDEHGREVGFTTGRDEDIETVRTNLYVQDAMNEQEDAKHRGCKLCSGDDIFEEGDA